MTREEAIARFASQRDISRDPQVRKHTPTEPAWKSKTPEQRQAKKAAQREALAAKRKEKSKKYHEWRQRRDDAGATRKTESNPQKALAQRHRMKRKRYHKED